MPDIRLTDDQAERLAALREDLAAEHAGPYGTVRDRDAVEYLLDLADAVDDDGLTADGPVAVDDGDEGTDAGDADGVDEGAGDEEVDAAADSDDGEGTDADDGDAGSKLDQMMSLLDTHSDKWRKADGDARYEVDLPDGGTEAAATKDDVRAVLFKKY